MFEIGRTYTFKMDEPQEAGVLCPAEFRGTVISVDMPLIKIDSAGFERVINVTSSAFIEASDVPEAVQVRVTDYRNRS